MDYKCDKKLFLLARKCKSKNELQNLLKKNLIPYEKSDIDALYKCVCYYKGKNKLDIDELEAVSGGSKRSKTTVVYEGRTIEYNNYDNNNSYIV